jgi:hypothetical protein
VVDYWFHGFGTVVICELDVKWDVELGYFVLEFIIHIDLMKISISQSTKDSDIRALYSHTSTARSSLRAEYSRKTINLYTPFLR